MEETKGSNILYSVSLALLVVVLILDNMDIIFETVPVNIMYVSLIVLVILVLSLILRNKFRQVALSDPLSDPSSEKVIE